MMKFYALKYRQFDSIYNTFMLFLSYFISVMYFFRINFGEKFDMKDTQTSTKSDFMDLINTNININFK